MLKRRLCAVLYFPVSIIWTVVLSIMPLYILSDLPPYRHTLFYQMGMEGQNVFGAPRPSSPGDCGFNAGSVFVLLRSVWCGAGNWAVAGGVWGHFILVCGILTPHTPCLH